MGLLYLLPPYPVRSFTYRNEQVRADEVQRVIVYSTRVIVYSTTPLSPVLPVFFYLHLSNSVAPKKTLLEKSIGRGGVGSVIFHPLAPLAASSTYAVYLTTVVSGPSCAQNLTMVIFFVCFLYRDGDVF
jgi:hypothetical protein